MGIPITSLDDSINPSWTSHVLIATRNIKFSTIEPFQLAHLNTCTYFHLYCEATLLKNFIFQVPPRINTPFDQGENICEIEQGTFSSFWEGFGDVSHCNNLSQGILFTSVNCSCKVLRRNLLKNIVFLHETAEL